MSRVRLALGLLLLGVVVVGVRAVGFERVLAGEPTGASEGQGAAVLALDDAQYHARRAAYTFENFPSVLAFDPYLNHPRGAWIPWPPLYDFALGAAARAVGDLDTALVWAPVLLGLLTALVVFGIGRRLAGPGVGLGAVAVFALLPVSMDFTAVGNPDHHAAVTFVGSLLLLGHVGLAGAGNRVGAVWGWQAALVAARFAMLLTWHGSLMYVVIAESVALLVASFLDRREMLLSQAVGCGLSALLGFVALGIPHAAVGGPWSAVEMSRLQPAAWLAAAVVAGLATRLPDRFPGRASRCAATAGLGVVAAAVLVGVAWDGVRLAWEYAARSEAFIAYNFEAQPLWRDGFGLAPRRWGWLALALPVAPVAGLLATRMSRDAGPGLILTGWTLYLLPLAVSNARYGSDFAPAASVSFALLAAALVRSLTPGRPGLRGAAAGMAVAAIPLLLWQPLQRVVPFAAGSLAALRGGSPVTSSEWGLSRTVHDFVARLRESTPETKGYLDPSQTPEYGIVSPTVLGFIVNRLGRRPTLAGNFGPYAGREGLEATFRFYGARREDAALKALRGLGVRYVIVTDEGEVPDRLWYRLHREDGSGRDDGPGVGHFRLVTESSRPGVPLGALRGVSPQRVEIPFKLFEIVPGARLQLEGEPGQTARVELDVETPGGRRFVYRTAGRVGEGGRGLVRIPYATTANQDPSGDAGPMVAAALGPARVQLGDTRYEVEIPESAVREGAVIAPDTGSAPDDPRPDPSAPPDVQRIPAGSPPGLAATGNSGTLPPAEGLPGR